MWFIFFHPLWISGYFTPINYCFLNSCIISGTKELEINDGRIINFSLFYFFQMLHLLVVNHFIMHRIGFSGLFVIEWHSLIAWLGLGKVMKCWIIQGLFRLVDRKKRIYLCEFWTIFGVHDGKIYYLALYIKQML